MRACVCVCVPGCVTNAQDETIKMLKKVLELHGYVMVSHYMLHFYLAYIYIHNIHDIYIYICLYTHTHTHTNTHAHTCMYMHIYGCNSICIHINLNNVYTCDIISINVFVDM